MTAPHTFVIETVAAELNLSVQQSRSRPARPDRKAKQLLRPALACIGRWAGV